MTRLDEARIFLGMLEDLTRLAGEAIPYVTERVGSLALLVAEGYVASLRRPLTDEERKKSAEILVAIEREIGPKEGGLPVALALLAWTEKRIEERRKGDDGRKA